MQVDPVKAFQRFASIKLAAKREGETPQRVLQMAALSLVLGQPDQALDYAKRVIKDDSVSVVAHREAIRLVVLGYCLKAAMLEGDCVGAIGPVRDASPKQYRLWARQVLEDLPDLDAEETHLLRRLRLAKDLKIVEIFIQQTARYD